jgi:hypothetical protein
MFGAEPKDTRTRRQKSRDGQRDSSQQAEMFHQGEVAQFGLTARPQLSLSAKTKLELARVDTRTQEEKEQDALKQASEQSPAMFPEGSHRTSTT